MTNTLKFEAAATLRNRVLSMAMEPGEALDEVILAQEFGLSRTPLRELIQRLVGEGYLIMEPNRGARVSPMDFVTLRHFFEAAPMVYAAMSRLAAENATNTQIEELKDCQRRYRVALGGLNASTTAMENYAFHRCIGGMARSPYLLPALERLLIDHTRIGHSFYGGRSKHNTKLTNEAADQHDAMIGAIENRQPARAVELTLEHWALSRDLMDHYVRPNPLDFQLEANRDAV